MDQVISKASHMLAPPLCSLAIMATTQTSPFLNAPSDHIRHCCQRIKDAALLRDGNEQPENARRALREAVADLLTICGKCLSAPRQCPVQLASEALPPCHSGWASAGMPWWRQPASLAQLAGATLDCGHLIVTCKQGTAHGSGPVSYSRRRSPPTVPTRPRRLCLPVPSIRWSCRRAGCAHR